MPTRQTILQQMAPFLGGRTGAIGSGTATTAVLDGLIGYSGIDGDEILLMPEASTAADQLRILSGWTTSSGTATWADNRTDTTYTDENFIMLPRAIARTLEDLRQALNEHLRNAKRSTRFVIPTRDDERYYSLADMDWLRSDKDIDLVMLRSSENMLDNEDFGKWQLGTALAPDSWTLAGTGAAVVRATTFASRGPYTAQLTRVSNDATLTQTVPYVNARELIEGLDAVAISVDVQTATAAAIRVGINDGVDTTWSDYHSGDGEVETLTATRTLTAAASRIQSVLSVDGNDATGAFDITYLTRGASVDAGLQEAGSNGLRERAVSYRTANVGSQSPTIILARSVGRGNQLIVVTRRAYAELSTDTGASGTTECPLLLCVHGALYRLASKYRPAEDRERLDLVAEIHGKTANELADDLIDLPTVGPQPRVVVGAA